MADGDVEGVPVETKEHDVPRDGESTPPMIAPDAHSTTATCAAKEHEDAERGSEASSERESSEEDSDAFSVMENVEQHGSRVDQSDVDEFQLQQLHLAFYHVCHNMEKFVKLSRYRRSIGINIAGVEIESMPTTGLLHEDIESALETLKDPLTAAKEPLASSKSGTGKAALLLLKCIMKVCEKNSKDRIQALLQSFMIEFLSPAEITRGVQLRR
eukprot:GEMP01074542.1.p1 GENE.GEMP01074542.1~~GEMP01074542.1.p1  ORF type:complete len:214 (+),score=51.84 GEMP01074542.1:311-952(+)